MTRYEVHEGDSGYLLLVSSDRTLATDPAEPGDRIVTTQWPRGLLPRPTLAEGRRPAA